MKKLLLIFMLLCLIISSVGCAGDKNGAISNASAFVTSTSTSSEAVKPKGKILSTDVWEAVPFVSQELRNLGFEGGEGCQAMPCITFDSNDGKIAYFGTDVGGIYKSTDGGKTWSQWNWNLHAAGANYIAIDPNNVDRVLLVGCDSGYNKNNGLYLTENGERWDYVYKAEEGFEGQIGIHNDRRHQIAWDKASYDEKIGGSAVAYWSRENRENHELSAKYNKPAIYKTSDGGKTWSKLEGTEHYAGGEITVDAANGNVIAANKNGVFLSTDSGKTWTKTLEKSTYSLSSVFTKSNFVWAATTEGIFRSEDAGNTWTHQADYARTTYDNLHSFVVSPADTNYMALTMIVSYQRWHFIQYVTHDGGETWIEGSRKESVGDIMPVSSWESVFTWHPTDKNILMGNGPYVSTDGGYNYNYSRTGFTGICEGGSIICNINNNNLIAMGSQDFNGGFSTDGGHTWTYVPWCDFSWGGHAYGTYIADENTVVAAASYGGDWNGRRCIAITFDGGKTVNRTQLEIKGATIGYGALGNDNIMFIGEWRSEDRGKTWNTMTNCTGVYEHDPNTGRLFGVNNYQIVYSDDNGLTWTKLCTSGDAVKDIAYNYNTKVLYVVGAQGVQSINVETGVGLLPLKGCTIKNTTGICVDPENSDIMYLCSKERRYADNFFRSLDGGATWTCLNRISGDGRQGSDGGRWCGSMIFNNAKREIIVTSSCRGLWKIDAAPEDTTN